MTMSLNLSCGVLQKYRVDGILLQANQSLYCRSQSLVCIQLRRSDPFPVRVCLRQGCSLSLVLFIIFMDRISRHSQVAEGVRFGVLRIMSLLFTDVVLLFSSNSVFHLTKTQSTAECEAAGMGTI